MNRAIKFRSWNGDMLSEPFAPWELVDTGCEGLMTKSGVSVFWGGCPQNWMQFTGLIDRNGKPIYEGGILQLQHTRGLFGRSAVTFEKGCFGITDSSKFLPIGRSQGNYMGDSKVWEIIGNVWENPELLPSLKQYCHWQYVGSCTHRAACGYEYFDESADTSLPEICPNCHKPIAGR